MNKQPQGLLTNIPWLGVGSEFYADQCDESLWGEYIEQMQRANIRYLRLFEYAWAALEPEMDDFQIDWADRLLGLLDHAGIKYMLSTPTGGAPRWLLRNYPAARVVGPEADRGEYANRRNLCPLNPDYRGRVSVIINELTSRWKDRKGLIGWQIDNEIGHPECHCIACRNNFIEWLKARYATPAALSDACGLAMWSQQLRYWEDLQTPHGDANPALRMLFRQWTSHKWLTFAASCKVEIQRYSLTPVVVNMMVPWHGFDHFEMAKRMDAVAIDYYPLYPDGAYPYSMTDLDMMLGYAKAHCQGSPFWVLETQAGGVGRVAPPPGAIMEWSMAMIAHGANALTYFRWDTPRFGGEELCFGVVGPGLYEDRIYTEVSEVAQRVGKIERELAESVPEKAEIGVYFNYASWWKHLDSWRGPTSPSSPSSLHNYIYLLRDHFFALESLGYQVDLCSAESDLSCYKFLVLPQLACVSRNEVEAIEAWVSEGGVLLLAAPGFTHDRDGAGYVAPYPSPDVLRRMIGTHYGPSGKLVPQCQPAVVAGDCILGNAVQWVEQLVITEEDVEILATYKSQDFYNLTPAVTVRQHGRGRAALLGCMLESYDQFYSHFFRHLNMPLAATPSGWWIRRRIQADGKLVLFQKNLSRERRSFEFHSPVETEESERIQIAEFEPEELKVFFT